MSVIIPLRDRESLVPHTLDSLAPEHHRGVALEVVVVDDGSSDGGPELVGTRYPAVRLIRQEARGAPAARNRGLAAATAEHVLLLDSDDLVEPGFFSPRLGALSQHPAASGAYGRWEQFAGLGSFDEGSIVPRSRPYPLEPNEQCDTHLCRLLGGWYIPVHAVLWRRSALERIGGQDESLSINQDVDMHFRMLASGATLVGCDAPRALYRRHDGSRQGASNSTAKHRQMLELRRRFASDLRSRGQLRASHRTELSRYCFHRWRELRRDSPEIARRFLALSRELEPRLSLEGRLPLRLLGAAVGAPRAVLIRDWLAGQ